MATCIRHGSSQHVDAPRSAVYRALLDADAIAQWRVPAGMSSEVARVRRPRRRLVPRVPHLRRADRNRQVRLSRPTRITAHFVKLVPDEQVVEVFEFETENPGLRGR